MSTYKFIVSKNNIAQASDEHITYVDADGDQDVDVTLWVNDQEIHAVTLTDAGASLVYTGTLSEGYHTVKIQPEAGKPTDIRIDQVLIDDNILVGSQYLLDTRIFGQADDFGQYKCCVPFRSPKGTDHVWWGQVYDSDYTVVSNTTHYRPHVVTDKGQWWEWSFSVTSNGHIHWSVDETDSILYDSTENNCYYAGKSFLNDSTVYPYFDLDAVSSWLSNSLSAVDSSTAVPFFVGPGVYGLDFINIEDMAMPVYDYDKITLLTESEYNSALWYYNLYWPSHNIEPIIVL